MYRALAWSRQLRCNWAAFRNISSERVIIDDGCSFVSLIENVVNPVQASDLFSSLCASEEIWRREVDDFGPQERLSAYFGDDDAIFAYVGVSCIPRKWPQPLSALCDRLNDILAQKKLLQNPITACLINNYEPDEGQIVWHYDEMRACGESKLVVSVSLGLGSRRFELCKRVDDVDDPDNIISITLPVGSALIMGKETQEHWLHRLPLDEGDAPHRLGLTFRSIVPGFESQLQSLDASSTRHMDDGIGREDIASEYLLDRSKAQH